MRILRRRRRHGRHAMPAQPRARRLPAEGTEAMNIAARRHKPCAERGSR